MGKESALSRVQSFGARPATAISRRCASPWMLPRVRVSGACVPTRRNMPGGVGLSLTRFRTRAATIEDGVDTAEDVGQDMNVEITFDGDADPEATLLYFKGKDCSNLLEPLSGALRDQGLVILSATVNPDDGVFRITDDTGGKLDPGAWDECKEKMMKYLAVTQIFSTQPLVYGKLDPSGTKPVQPINNQFLLDNVTSLRKTASEVMEAARKLSDIEQEIVELMGKGGTPDSPDIAGKEAKRSEAAALLDRPLLALEAMLVMRRKPTIAPEPEAVQDFLTQVGPAISTGPAAGTGSEILLQGFNWDSHHQDWYKVLGNQASEIAKAGFTSIWLPPPSDSVSSQGYLPRDLYNLNSRYGSEADLRECIQKLRQNGLKVLADIVINHRCAQYQGHDGKWNKFGGRLPWDASAICNGNPEFGGRGNRKKGEEYMAAPNIDHSQKNIRNDITNWMNFLRKSIGFDGWRFDFVKGYSGEFLKQYIDATVPQMAIGEYWDTCEYTNGVLNYNQNNHRQRTINWCDSTGGTSAAFDFTTKGILQEAVARREYWRLVDEKGCPPGLLGVWPSRAVLFVDNHDTGSSLQHWPFPSNNLCEGYAYILTHPGTPCVFYDHLWDGHKELGEKIRQLLAVRRRNGINCRSKIKIPKAVNDFYASVIDECVAMKIGPGDWSPNHDDTAKNLAKGRRWSVSCSGHNFAVWEIEK
ncbi:hypothetical protein BSKO_12690 [Bryopsis sp. KO-2023]|nr:hypothetical protein BSKO_12690 [Bryopsis sp. KO-2023]